MMMNQTIDILSVSQADTTNDVPRCDVTHNEVGSDTVDAGTWCKCRTCQAYQMGWDAANRWKGREKDDVDFIRACRARLAAQRKDDDRIA